MGTYLGTNLNDIIIPGFVSAGVFRFPFGSTPGAAADLINGNGGNDVLAGGGGNDTVNGGTGNDNINGGTGNDILNGDDGNDVIVGGGGADVVNGGNGNDTLTGGFGVGASVFGGAGNDLIFAVNGTPELINGGTGIDTLNTTAFAGNYVVNLTTGGTNFAGELFLNMENLISGAGNDTLIGTGGTNVIDGGNGNDVISGLAGNDLLRGGNNNDTLFGGIGNDQLRGGAGNDRLIGGPGADTLVGGLGNDVFAFFANDSFPGSRDTIVAGDGAVAFQGPGITLFGAPNDRIDLSAIDANTATLVNDAFVFGGAGTGHVVLSNEAATGNTLVRASTDADAAFEVEIAIADGAGVTAANYWVGDFVL